VHGADECAVVRSRDAGLNGDREETLASSVNSTGGRRRLSDRKENLFLLSDWEENLFLLPVLQALGSANAGDGRCDCDDRIGNDAYCRKDDGDDSGGVYSVSSADAPRSMMRRMWTLPLNVVSHSCLTVA
jgi:hypothetical protein